MSKAHLGWFHTVAVWLTLNWSKLVPLDSRLCLGAVIAHLNSSSDQTREQNDSWFNLKGSLFSVQLPQEIKQTMSWTKERKREHRKGWHMIEIINIWSELFSSCKTSVSIYITIAVCSLLLSVVFLSSAASIECMKSSMLCSRCFCLCLCSYWVACCDCAPSEELI